MASKSAHAPKDVAPVKGRAYQMGVVMGPPGFGKSTLIEELIENYRKQGGRVWIVDPAHNWSHDKSAWWTNRADLDKHLETLKKAGPGLLVLDDADGYMRHPTDARLDFMVAFRHYQKDVILVSRRPQGIPKDAIESAEWLALFAIREPYARAYVAKAIGEGKIMREIPHEKYHYLYIHRESETRAIYQTKARKVLTTSDMR